MGICLPDWTQVPATGEQRAGGSVGTGAEAQPASIKTRARQLDAAVALRWIMVWVRQTW